MSVGGQLSRSLFPIDTLLVILRQTPSICVWASIAQSLLLDKSLFYQIWLCNVFGSFGKVLSSFSAKTLHSSYERGAGWNSEMYVWWVEVFCHSTVLTSNLEWNVCCLDTYWNEINVNFQFKKILKKLIVPIVIHLWEKGKRFKL